MTTNAQPAPTAQEEFDRTYITSSEICQLLSVSRSSIVHARRGGLLPDPITLNNQQIFLWVRTTVQPYIDAWKVILTARRSRD